MEQDFKDKLVVNQNDYSEGRFVDKKDYKFKEFNEIDDEERVNLYESYYEKQIPHFEAYLEFVNKIMCVLKHYRIVTGRTKCWYSWRIRTFIYSS